MKTGEMRALLRSRKPEDQAVFAARLALTPPDKAFTLLEAAIGQPTSQLTIVLMLLGPVTLLLHFLLWRVLAGTGQNWLNIPRVSLFETIVLAPGYHIYRLIPLLRTRITGLGLQYMAGLNDHRAVEVLLKYRYPDPVTVRQREWNAQCHRGITRLLDELDETELGKVPTNSLRNLFEQQYFGHLGKTRRPVDDADTYMMVAILRFLMIRTRPIDENLCKRILAHPAKSRVNANTIATLHEVAESLLTHEEPSLKLYTPTPQTTQAVIQRGRF